MCNRTVVLLVALMLVVSLLHLGFAQESETAADPGVAQPEVAAETPSEAAAETPSEATAETPPLEATDEAESQFDLKLDGSKTWTVRYGFGSPLALATSGVSPGSLTLDQSLTVDITGTALSVLRIEAHYNDQLPDSMQSVAIYLDTERLDGVLGDFTFGGVPDFTSYMRKMKGLQLEYRFGDAVLTAVASRAEGIAETVVFVGQTAHADIEFSRWLESGSDTAAPYRRNLDGLYAYQLQTLYAEEFSSLYFQFSPSAGLRSVFGQYEVGYLFDALASVSELAMKDQDFLVLDTQEQYLLLQRNPLFLIRDRLRDLVSAYNSANGLSGADAKAYPFIVGTDYEMEFLTAVLPFAQIVVDDIVYPVSSAERRRFYSLGHTDVQESSVRVEVSTDGETFQTVPGYRLEDYSITIDSEAGILECDFPASFYSDTSVIRVAFDYATTEGAFMLGLALIPGTERVMLNSEVLEPDVDYVIDYEVGMLFLLVDMTDTDVLQVDYERYASGFGASSDYASYFYGLTLDLPVSDVLSIRANLLQLADVEGSTANREGVTTMPNRHTIAGATAELSLGDFSANVLLGYNYDVFPFDDNDRMPLANEITAIAAADGYVVFGHHGGLTVYEDGVWETYGVQSGLSSYVVQAIAIRDGIVYVGTDAGLTAIALEGASPFDRAVNWSHPLAIDELPSSSVTALLADEDGLWIGTDDGLARWTPDAASDTEHALTTVDAGAGALPPVTSLARDGGVLYVGTQSGLFSYDTASDQMELLPGTDASTVNDLVVADQMLYVASNRGLRGFQDGRGTGWLLLGTPVLTIDYVDEQIYYGTGDGLFRLDAPSPLIEGWPVTSLGRSPEGLWVGVRAGGDYEMKVWLVASKTYSFSEAVTGIPGRNPYVFADSDASEHTVTGWVSRASFQQTTDRYALQGVVEFHPATFRAIGSRSRSDSSGWTLSGQFPLADWGEIDATHEYRLIDQSGDDPSYQMGNSVNAAWSLGEGPQWHAGVTYNEEGASYGSETVTDRELSTSFSMRESFFRDKLVLDLAWSRYDPLSASLEEEWERQSLKLSFDWDLTSELSTSGSWTRPVRRLGEDLLGSERIHWKSAWSPALAFGDLSIADVDVEYALDGSRSFSDETLAWEHAAEVRFDGTPFELAGWNISPDLSLEGAHDAAATDLHAELATRSVWEDLTIRTTLRGHLTDLGRPVFNREGELTINARYAGQEGLSPSLTYTGNRREAVKGTETALTTSDTVTGRLVWAPEDGPRDEASFTLLVKTAADTRQVTLTADNSFTMNLSSQLKRWLSWDEEAHPDGMPVADLRVDSDGEYRLYTETPEASFSTRGELFVSWPPNWSVSVAATYSLGFKSAIGFYHGMLFEITFAVDF